MIEKALEFRQMCIRFYKSRENVVLFCFRLLLGIFVFSIINSIGLHAGAFDLIFKPPLNLPYFLLSALFFALLPPTLANGLIALEVVIQISGSIEVASFAALAFVLILVFYTRVQPKESYLIIAIIIAFYLKIPYAVVIFAGIYMGLTSIIPIIIGTVIYQFIPIFGNLAKSLAVSGEIDIFSLPETFLEVYRYIFESFTSVDNFSWIYVGFSFAIVIVAIHILSKASINYSKEMAIIIGGVLNLVCGIIGIAIGSYNESIIPLSLFAVLSIALIFIVRFFDCVLDYRRVERVQFEDDDNFYYVKMIPKKMVSDRKENDNERT